MQKNPIPESGNNTDSQGWDLIIYKKDEPESTGFKLHKRQIIRLP